MRNMKLLAHFNRCFCGGEARITYQMDAVGLWCAECKTCGKKFVGENSQEVMALWNYHSKHIAAESTKEVQYEG